MDLHGSIWLVCFDSRRHIWTLRFDSDLKYSKTLEQQSNRFRFWFFWWTAWNLQGACPVESSLGEDVTGACRYSKTLSPVILTYSKSFKNVEPCGTIIVQICSKSRWGRVSGGFLVSFWNSNLQRMSICNDSWAQTVSSRYDQLIGGRGFATRDAKCWRLK
jgi:hypothetical protein